MSRGSTATMSSTQQVDTYRQQQVAPLVSCAAFLLLGNLQIQVKQIPLHISVQSFTITPISF